MRKIAMGLLAITLSAPVIAADGYKTLKFGMTKEQVRDEKVCSFGGEQKIYAEVESMSCDDFEFSGYKTTLKNYFVDERLSRVSVDLLSDVQMYKVIGELSKKYGVDGDGGLASVKDETGENALESRHDNGTILVRMALDDDGNPVSAQLIYTVKDYDDVISKALSKVDNGDL